MTKLRGKGPIPWLGSKFRSPRKRRKAMGPTDMNLTLRKKYFLRL